MRYRAALCIAVFWCCTQAASAQPAVRLTGFTVTPELYEPGPGLTATVTLSGPAPSGGAFVAFTYSDLSVVNLLSDSYRGVTVPAGKSQETFLLLFVRNTRIRQTTPVTITATYGAGAMQATIRVCGFALRCSGIVHMSFEGLDPNYDGSQYFLTTTVFFKLTVRNLGTLPLDSIEVHIIIRDPRMTVVHTQQTGTISVNPGQMFNSPLATSYAAGWNGVPGRYTIEVTLRVPNPLDGMQNQIVTASRTAEFDIRVSEVFPPPQRVFSHVAAGRDWKTTFTLVNPSSARLFGAIRFFGADGAPWFLPVRAFSGATSNASTSSVAFAIEGNGSVTLETGPREPLQVGHAVVEASGPVAGLAVFQQRSEDGGIQEASVSLTSTTGAVTIPFDNTAEVSTGIALATVADSPVMIEMTARDEAGVTLIVHPRELRPKGHVAFFTAVEFSQLAGRRGTIEFRMPSGHPVIAGIGLRFHLSGTFTSVPPVIP